MPSDHAQPEVRPAAPRRRSPVKRLVALGVVLAVVAGVAWGLLQISKARCFALLGPLMCRVETTRPLVALTFDDGPTAAGLDAILPTLEANGARATFFVVGQVVEQRPDLARRIVRAGHEVANHSYSHQRMVFRSQGFYESELERTENLLDDIRRSEEPGVFFRPPYGKKLPGLALAARKQGLVMVTWDVEEPTTTDPAQYAREIVGKARPGSIVLMHAMHPANATARAALPLVLQGLRAKGFRVVTVTELSDIAAADAEAKARAKKR